jgi:hypothetical protein
MKQADEAIDRVLTGLRESQAPAGMENRILQAMQAHATGESAKRFVWWSWPRTAGYGALLAGLLVVVAVSVPHRAHQAVQELVVRKRVEVEPAPVAEAKVPRKVTKPLLVRVEKQNAGQKGVQDSNAAEDELAREEMLAPSHPAPPLPMTAQERLLERVVSRHGLRDLAILNSEERDKTAAREDEAFKKFFGIKDRAKEQQEEIPGTKDIQADPKLTAQSSVTTDATR